MKPFSKSPFICSNRSWEITYVSGEARLIFEEPDEAPKIATATTRRREEEVRATEAAGKAFGGEVVKKIDKFDPKAKRREAKRVLAEAAKIKPKSYGPVGEGIKNPYEEEMPAHVKLFIRRNPIGDKGTVIGYDIKTREPKLLYPPSIGVVTVAKPAMRHEDGRVFFAVSALAGDRSPTYVAAEQLMGTKPSKKAKELKPVDEKVAVSAAPSVAVPVGSITAPPSVAETTTEPAKEAEQEEYGPHPEPPELLVPGAQVEITGPTILRDPKTGRAITVLPVGAAVEITKKAKFKPTEREPDVGDLHATIRFGEIEGEISLENAVLISRQRAAKLEAGRAKEAIVQGPREATPPQVQAPQEKKEEELDPKKIYVLHPHRQKATIIAYVTDIVPLREQTGAAICTIREPNGNERNIAVTAQYNKNGRPILEQANAQQVATYMRSARNA